MVPGRHLYSVSTIKAPSYVGLFGHHTWSYHDFGSTELILNNESAACMIDLTGSLGARVSGLGLNGARLGNGVRGIYLNGRAWNGAITMVGNRIEWNYLGGVLSACGGHYSINNNYIDRSGGPGIHLHGGMQVDRDQARRASFSITGNVIHRSGAKLALGDEHNCHVYLDFLAGVSLTSNVMSTGRNDSGTGQLSPTRWLVYKGLRDSVIKDNTLYHGAVKALIVDGGDNDETCIVKDNPGRLQEVEQK